MVCGDPPGSLHLHFTHCWHVKATSSGTVQWSDPSGGFSFYIIDNQTPVLIQPRAVAQENGILVTWNISEGLGLNGVRVSRRPADPPEANAWQTLTPLLPAGSQSGSYLDSEVEPGMRYEYSVEAFGPGGSAGWTPRRGAGSSGGCWCVERNVP